MTEQEAFAESIAMHLPSRQSQQQLLEYCLSHNLHDQGEFTRNQGDCGPDATVLLTTPGLTRADWTEDYRSAQSLNERVTNGAWLLLNWDMELPGYPGLTFRMLPRGLIRVPLMQEDGSPLRDGQEQITFHTRQETEDEYVTRMSTSGPASYWETPSLAASAVIHDRPIDVIVTSATHQPAVHRYYPATDAGLQREPVILGLRNTAVGPHYIPITDTGSPFSDESTQDTPGVVALSSARTSGGDAGIPCPALAIPSQSEPPPRYIIVYIVLKTDIVCVAPRSVRCGNL